MRLQRLLSLALVCLYVCGATFQDHHSHCEGHFHKGWAHVLLLLKKASVDFDCRCHKGKCLSIAIFPALRYVPVLWAYKIGHKGVSDLSEQDLLRNIATWYISPLAVEDLLRGKLHSLPPQVTSHPSTSITHVLSGVYHLNEKYAQHIGNWSNPGSIHWIAYQHTNEKGLRFEGALVQNSQQKCTWKWMALMQLVTILSGVYLPKPMQTLFGDHNGGPVNLNAVDDTMACVAVAKMQITEADRDVSDMTTSSKPLTSDMIAGTCSALIHRTSTGLKRCLERLMLEKEKYITSSPLWHFSVT